MNDDAAPCFVDGYIVERQGGVHFTLRFTRALR